MKTPIRTKGNSIVIEIPADIKGKKKFEQWGNGIAQMVADEGNADLVKTLTTALKAQIALDGFVKELKEQARSEIQALVGDSVNGVAISNGSETQVNYDYSNSATYSELKDTTKNLETVLKGMFKAKQNGKPDDQNVQVFLNHVSGETETLTVTDIPEQNVTKKFPFNMTV